MKQKQVNAPSYIFLIGLLSLGCKTSRDAAELASSDPVVDTPATSELRAVLTRDELSEVEKRRFENVMRQTDCGLLGCDQGWQLSDSRLACDFQASVCELKARIANPQLIDEAGGLADRLLTAKRELLDAHDQQLGFHFRIERQTVSDTVATEDTEDPQLVQWASFTCGFSGVSAFSSVVVEGIAEDYFDDGFFTKFAGCVLSIERRLTSLSSLEEGLTEVQRNNVLYALNSEACTIFGCQDSWRTGFFELDCDFSDERCQASAATTSPAFGDMPSLPELSADSLQGSDAKLGIRYQIKPETFNDEIAPSTDGVTGYGAWFSAQCQLDGLASYESLMTTLGGIDYLNPGFTKKFSACMTNVRSKLTEIFPPQPEEAP